MCDSVCSELRAEEGVLLVTPGRQAEVSKVVSQVSLANGAP
jgi:hypothetical protein